MAAAAGEILLKFAAGEVAEIIRDSGSDAPRERVMLLSWPGRKAMLPRFPGTTHGNGSARSGSGGLSESVQARELRVTD